MRCEDLSICTTTPAVAGSAHVKAASAARRAIAARRMAPFCPVAPPLAATLRNLGKRHARSVNGWKFAEKADYLSNADSRGGMKAIDDRTRALDPPDIA